MLNCALPRRRASGTHLALKGKLEIHAGNYPCLDLQQLATHLICEQQIAATVFTTVVSSYPDRDGGEGMCDAGALAMSKDRGPNPGFGDVVTPGWENWRLGRISQEHGGLTRAEGKQGKELERWAQCSRSWGSIRASRAHAFPGIMSLIRVKGMERLWLMFGCRGEPGEL
ncbi:hypothetical protein DACRYDRAFT_104132 [Dacryopinax primogenitus]|uniref:D-serine dehydratase-like domain-containing protein n=1 Tax=Dacryopinax primogenitus (strain DJM 731) TaxID=1858805 RepID=M5GGK5_DACPD|nr:uncharacterized protein DACRYDRAFT_104132 [Dacryopinax primogenitus]EJU05648.1 hypothetical protein DACRYDRAFT_104132 [Dacryopinax primogenitus]